jgi:Ca-activated chloride channel homolog
MSLLAPAALLFGLLAVPILVLYMLKLRRRETLVSSTMLWQKLLRDRQANAPWQRLERSLLLILQLLLLAALVLALARPALPVHSLASGTVVVVLDASASMNARDVAPNRFEAGKQAVQALIDDLPARARMTLVLAGPQPRTLLAAEQDKNRLTQALVAAQPSQGLADWEAALTLAAGALRSSGEDQALIIVSDGGLPAEGLPPMAAEVLYIPIGERSENLAITALALSTSGTGLQLFAAVSSFSNQPRQAILSFYTEAGLFRSENIQISPGERREFVVSGLDPNHTRYTARLSPVDSRDQALDDLPLDDTAYAIYRPPQGGRALIVTPGNFFLTRLLQAIPEVQAARFTPPEGQAVSLPAQDYEVYVFDGVLPDQLPEGSLLLINPPPNALFSVAGVFTPTGVIPVASHPLTAYLDWSPVNVLRARQVQLPGWAAPLVGTASSPLVFAGETGGRRVAVITFDLLDSDLPLQLAFPVLFANLLDYLLESQPVQQVMGETALRPGAPIVLRPPAGVETITVISPGGSAAILAAAEGEVIFSPTDELGVYTLRYGGSTTPPEDYFVVNLFTTAESDLTPQQAIQVGRSEITPQAGEALGQRELWPWLAAASLGLLLLEWWVYHRRQRLPGESVIERVSARVQPWLKKENRR